MTTFSPADPLARILGATLCTLLATVAERAHLTEAEIERALDLLDADELAEHFWSRFGGPLTDRLESTLVLALQQGAQAGWERWDW